MTDESPQSELERLRAEVESYKQRETAELKSALASARAEAAQYREEALKWQSEARRLSEAGKDLAREAERRENSLRMQLTAKQNVLAAPAK